MKKLTLLMSLISLGVFSQNQKITKLIDEVEPKVIEWRRDFHEYPELSNREFETSK